MKATNKITVLLLCINVFAGGILVGCTKSEVAIKAKEHSREVVTSIYRDTVLTLLRSRYLPYKDTKALIQQFRDRYEPGTLRGGFRNERYYKNLSGNDEVSFLYEYKSDKQVAKLQLTYEIIKDTFVVKSLVIYNSP